MTEQELQAIINQLIAEGRSDAYIMQVLNELEAQSEADAMATSSEPWLQGNIPTTTQPQEEITKKEEEAISATEEEIADVGRQLAELKRKQEEEAAFEKEREATEMRQFAFSEVTGIPEWAVSAFASLGASTAGLAGGIVKQAEGATLGVMELIHPEMFQDENGNPDPEKRKAAAMAVAMGLPGTTFGGSAGADQTAEAFSDYVDKYDEGITESIRSGKFAQAGGQIVDGVAGAIPSLAMAMTGVGGVVGLGISTSGSKWSEEYQSEENKDVSTATILLDGLGAGAIEATSELVTRGLLKGAGHIFKAAAGKGAGAAATTAAKDIIAGASESMVKAMGMEGGSEAAAVIATALWDKLVLGKDIDWKRTMTEASDNFIIGAVMGGGIAAPGKIAQKIGTPKTIEENESGAESAPEETTQVAVEGSQTTQEAREEAEADPVNADKPAVTFTPEQALYVGQRGLSDFDKQSRIDEINQVNKIDADRRAAEEQNKNETAKELQRLVEEKSQQIQDKNDQDIEAGLNMDPDSVVRLIQNQQQIEKNQRTLEDPDLQDETRRALEEENNQLFIDQDTLRQTALNYAQNTANIDATLDSIEQSNLDHQKVVDSAESTDAQKKKARQTIKENKAKSKELSEISQESRVSKSAKTIDAMKTKARKSVRGTKANKIKVLKEATNDAVKVLKGKEGKVITRVAKERAVKQVLEGGESGNGGELSNADRFEKLAKKYYNKVAGTWKDSDTSISEGDVLSTIQEYVVGEGLDSFTGDTDFMSHVEANIPRIIENKYKGKFGPIASGSTIGPRAQQEIDNLKGEVDFLRDEIKRTDDPVYKSELKKSVKNLQSSIRALKGGVVASRSLSEMVGENAELIPGRGFEQLHEAIDGAVSGKARSRDNTVSKANPKTKRNVEKTLGLNTDNIKKIKDSISKGLEGVDMGGSVKSVNKSVAKNIKNNLTGILRPLNKVDNIVDNAEAIQDILKTTGVREGFAGGTWDGDLDLTDIYNYYTEEGKAKERIRALKGSMAEAVVDNFIDEALDDTQKDTVMYFEDLGSNRYDNVAGVVSAVNRMKAGFPDVRVFISKARLQETLIAANIDPAKAEGIGGLYNNTDGEIIVNPDRIKLETPIHEFAHVWLQQARTERPDLYKRGTELMKNSTEYLELTEKRNNKDSVYYKMKDQQFEEEVLATLVGKRGTEIFEQAESQKKWDQYLKELFDWVKTKLGFKGDLQEMNLGDFLDVAAGEIFSGERLYVTKGQPVTQGVDGTLNFSENPGFRLSDEIMLNPAIKNAIKAEPVPETKRFKHNIYSDKQARDTVRGAMDVLSFLKPDARNFWTKEFNKMFSMNKFGDERAAEGEVFAERYGLHIMHGNEILEAFVANLESPGLYGDADYTNIVRNYKGKQAAIKDLMRAMGEAIRADRLSAGTIQTLKSAITLGQSDTFRSAAPIAFESRSGKRFIKEHVLPVTKAFDQLIEASTEDDFDARADQVLDGYVQVKLNADQDARLNEAGFKEVMPKPYYDSEFKLGRLPKSFVRYFNGHVVINPVDLISTGIDKRYAAGKTAAQYLGISQAGSLKLRDIPIGSLSFREVESVNDANALTAEERAKNREAKVKEYNKLLNQNFNFKQQTPYKKSKVTQELRDYIHEQKQLIVNGGIALLSDSALDRRLLQLQRKIDAANKERLSRQKRRELKKDIRSKKVADYIQETSGINPETLIQSDVKTLARENSSFVKLMKEGKVGTMVSKMLSPDSNNDFYGLLYSMLPKGAARNKAKEFFKSQLTDPLEKANLKHIQLKFQMKDNWSGLMEKAATKGFKESDLRAKTGIEVGGTDLNNSQVIKLYNYIKDPALHAQLIDGGVTEDIMADIIAHVQTNEGLEVMAEGIPSLFSPYKEIINDKLDQHGYKGVENAIIPGLGEALSRAKDVQQAAQVKKTYRILNSIYRGSIPTEAPYTPMTAKGVDNTLNIDTMLAEGKDFYSVMSGNLKARRGGGQVDFTNGIETDIDRYMRGPIRTISFIDFAKNASDIFSSKNLKAMEAAYGTDWSDSMKDSLRTIITGRNVSGPDTKANQWVRSFLNNTIGGIMFLNTRSAVLQLLSTSNFAVEQPGAVFNGMTAGTEALGDAFKMIVNSQWMKQRGEGATNIETEEIFSEDPKSTTGKVRNYLLQQGYSLTKMGDKGAIAAGGMFYVAGRIKEGVPADQALSEFVSMAEETQQSTRPERIGREQRSPLGRMLLAFANTPMQYNRKMSRALKDMTAKGTSRGDKLHAASKIMYYGVLQNAIFTALQHALFMGLDLEEDEDQDKVYGAINSMVDTLSRGSGVYGAVFATLKNMIMAYANSPEGKKKSEKVGKAMIGLMPALRTKYTQVERAVDPRYWEESKGLVDVDPWVAQAANAIAFTTNYPAHRILTKLEGVNDIWAQDLDTMEKVLRIMGWGRYTIGKTININKGKGKSYGPSSRNYGPKSPANYLKINEVNDSEPGVLGRANKDGTIDIDPNLKGEEREKVIRHEAQHAEQMKSGRMDYTDNSITWEGKTYPRKDGKIKYKGKWVIEGSKSFPWEQEADAAENSPAKYIEGTGSEYGPNPQPEEEESVEPVPFVEAPKHDPNALSNFVKDFEGFHDKTYLDAIGIPTIGYGRTGEDVTEGGETTRDAEEEWLANRLSKDRNYVANKMAQYGYGDLSPNQLDALTSFVYNAGKGRLKNLTKEGSRSIEEVGKALLKYDKAGGKPLAGLTRRRRAESEMFFSPAQ